MTLYFKCTLYLLYTSGRVFIGRINYCHCHMVQNINTGNTVKNSNKMNGKWVVSMNNKDTLTINSCLYNINLHHNRHSDYNMIVDDAKV